MTACFTFGQWITDHYDQFVWTVLGFLAFCALLIAYAVGKIARQ